MTQLEITTDATVPTSTSITVSVLEDTNADGSADNSTSISISGGVNTYTVNGYDGATGNDVWLTVETDTSDYETTASITSVDVTAVAPASPDTVQQSINGDDDIDVTWDADTSSGSPDYYEVAVSEDGGTYSKLAEVTTTSYNYAAPTDVNTFKFRVHAVNGGGSSNWSYTSEKSTDPTSLSTTVVSGDQIDLSWTGTDDEDQYSVLRAQSSGTGRADYAEIGTTTTPSFSDTGLEDGERYYYRVQSIYTGTDSQLSNEANGITALPAPSSLTLDASTEDQIGLSWTNNDDSSDGSIEIYRSADGALGSLVTSFTDLTTTSYTDTGLNDGEKYHYTVRRSTDHATADSSQQSAVTVLPAPTTVTVDATTTDSIDVSWTNNHDYGDVDLEIRRSSASSWTADATVSGSTTTHTYATLLNGEEYDLRVLAATEHTRTAATPVAGTTNIPDAQTPTLGNGVEDEVAVERESAVTNYGDVRIQIRETAESSWDSNAAGFGEFVGNYDTLTMEFTGREDGEEYEVRARTETEHVIGAWTSTVSIVTVFPGATNLSVVDTTSQSVTIEWQDNADNEDGTRIWRRDELDTRRDTGFGDWSVVDTIGPTSGDANMVEYTDNTIEPNHDYEYYVEPYTEHTSAESSRTSPTTTAIAVPNEGWFIILERSDGEKATVPHDVVDAERASLEPEMSAVARWSFDIVPNDVLRDWLRSEALIYYEGTLWLRGPYTRYSPDGGSGGAAAQIEGLGSFDHLKSGAYSYDVVSEPGHEAFGRFVDENLGDWVADVTAPANDTVDENWLVQDASTESEFTDEFGTIPDDQPYTHAGGDLRPEIAAYHFDARDASGSYNTGNRSEGGSDDYVDGFTTLLESGSDYLEGSISLDYTIPSEYVGVAIRQGADDAPAMTWNLDGNEMDSLSGSTGYISFGWTDHANDPYNGDGYTGGDLSGTVDVRIECDGGGSDEAWAADWIVLYDTRYFDVANFDDTTDSDDQLSGPNEYPAVDIASKRFSQEYNVSAADLDITVDDTSGQQRLQASNDTGNTWLPNDGTESSTASISVDFEANDLYGTGVKGRVTLGAYGSRTGDTPTEGFRAQTVSSWELRIDTTSLRVIDDQTFTGSAYEVIDSIADESNMVYVPDYRESQLAMDAFQPGDVVRDVAWTVEDAQPVDTTEGYFNKITIFGPEQDDGTRLTATAESSDEIAEKGEVVGPAKERPDAKTKEELRSIARTELQVGLANDTVTGKLDISGQFVQPGYAYSVDEFASFDERTDPAYVLQSASYSWGVMSLDFEGRNSLARAIRSIETEVRTTKRAV